MIALANGTVLTPCREIGDGVVLVDGAQIVAVGPRRLVAIPDGITIIDAAGGYIAPGYIDLHCHGALGINVGDSRNTIEDFRRIAEFKARNGTTSFLLGLPTASPDSMARSLRLVHEAVGRHGGAEILGAQAEGPYFSADAKGAQAVEHMRSPCIEEFNEWLNLCPELLLLSLAPEVDGALDLIAHARRRGVTVSVGHSRASYDQVMMAVSAGLSHATHTFNGMLGLHHRAPGTVGAILTCDEIMAEAIVDNIHLHPAIVDLIVRCKGVERTVLVTDAIGAVGLPDGNYTWDGRPVTVRDGAVRLGDGTIAGSTLTMERAVRNVISDARVSTAEAVRMASMNPARSLRINDRKGSLAPGYDADVIVLDENMEVEITMVGGEVVYRRGGTTGT